MKRYYEEITFIRAVACLLVLLTHVTLMYPLEELSVSTRLNLMVNQFARVGTPIFCVISAFLLFNTFKDKPLDSRLFIISRTKKIVIPYLIWSIIYLVIMELTGKGEFQLGNVWHYLFLGESYVHLYFIAIVLQFYILFMMTYHIFNKGNIARYTLMSIIIMMAWFVVRDQPLAVNHRAFIINWIGFFMMGGYMAYHLEKIKHKITQYSNYFMYYVIIAMMVLLVEMDIPNLFTSDRMMNVILVPLMIAFIMHLFFKSGPYTRYIMQYIGNRAMGIYLVHMLVIGFLGEVIPVTFWNPHLLIINYILVIIMTLFIVECLKVLPYSQYLFPVAKSPNKSMLNWQFIKSIRL